MTDSTKRSQAALAYEELERRLVTLELAPGRLLLEKELADSLGFGRTPMREAIQRCEAHGLLRVYPRKGIQVEPIDATGLSRVLEARRVLERLLVVKATERADQEMRSELQQLARQLEQVGRDPATLFQLDRQLDDLLSRACDNDFLVQALAPLHVHCRRLWYMFRSETDTMEAAQLHANLARSVALDSSAGAITALNGIIAILESFQQKLAGRS